MNRPRAASVVRGLVRYLARWGVPVAVLAVLVDRLGTGPFLRAADRLTMQAVLAACLLTAATTLCAAARWAWVAARLDLPLGLGAALRAYYRSLLVNQLLPGGVLGDVERAVRHGRPHAASVRAARAVAWERAIGQAGLLVVAALVVALFPSALRGSLVWALPVAVVLAGAAAALAAAAHRRARGNPHPAIGVVGADLRRLRGGGPPWLPLMLSAAAAVGHLALLVVASRTAQVDVTVAQAVPLLTVVLVCSSLPTNLAGWGPREGAAAWVFAAAGQTAADGVTIAAVYGLLSLAGTAPGPLLFLARGSLARRTEVPST